MSTSKNQSIRGSHSITVVAESVQEIQEIHDDDEIDDDAVAVNLGPNRSHFKPFDVIGEASNY